MANNFKNINGYLGVPQEEEKDWEDKAMEYAGSALEKVEPVLKVLGYPGGLVRGTIAGGLEAATGRDDLVDIKDVLKGEAPSTSEILEKLGVEEMGSLSEALPELYSETGKGLALQKGGMFDPTLRGALGFAGDVVTDPLTYLAGAGAAAKGAEALSESKPAFQRLRQVLADERGSFDTSKKAIKKPLELKDLTQVLPGIYSQAEKTVLEKMGERAKAAQIFSSGEEGIGGLLASSGVKPEEIKFLKIPEFLEGKEFVTKEELLKHIRENLPNLKIKDFGNRYSTFGTHHVPGRYQYKGIQYNPNLPKEVKDIVTDRLKGFDEKLKDILDLYGVTDLALVKKMPKLERVIKDFIDDEVKHFGTKKAEEAKKILQELDITGYSTEEGQLPQFEELVRDVNHYEDNPNIIGHYRSKVVEPGFTTLGKYPALDEINEKILNLEKESRALLKQNPFLRLSEDSDEFIDTFTGESAKLDSLTPEELKKIQENTQKLYNINERILIAEQDKKDIIGDIIQNQTTEESPKYIMDEAQSQPHHAGATHGYLTKDQFEFKKRYKREKDKILAKLKELDNEYKRSDQEYSALKEAHKVDIESKDEIYDKYLAKLPEEMQNESMFSKILYLSRNSPEYVQEMENFEARKKAFNDSQIAKNLKKSYDDAYEAYSNYRDNVYYPFDDKASEVGRKVPDLPFKKDAIYELLGKLMAYDAAESGAGHVILPTAKTQVERFPTGSQKGKLSEITVKREKGSPKIRIQGDTYGESDVFRKTLDQGAELESIIPPEYLKNIKRAFQARSIQPGRPKNWSILNSSKEGEKFIGPLEDLIQSVTLKKPGMYLGGGRFRKIYDKILPDLLKKINQGKKLSKKEFKLLDDLGASPKPQDAIMEMTPDVREGILKYGFPLWMIPFIIGESEEESPKFDKIRKALNNKPL